MKTVIHSTADLDNTRYLDNCLKKKCDYKMLNLNYLYMYNIYTYLNLTYLIIELKFHYLASTSITVSA